jgi:hypothetical protein
MIDWVNHGRSMSKCHLVARDGERREWLIGVG